MDAFIKLYQPQLNCASTGGYIMADKPRIVTCSGCERECKKSNKFKCKLCKEWYCIGCIDECDICRTIFCTSCIGLHDIDYHSNRDQLGDDFSDDDLQICNRGQDDPPSELT